MSRTCENCENCIYIEEGDSICNISDPEIVIDNWVPIKYAENCKGYKEIEQGYAKGERRWKYTK